MSVLKVRGADGKWRDIPSIKGEPGDLVPHAHRHKTGGEDAITPADIGASAEGHTHTAGEVGAASIMHNSTHAIGGEDPLEPDAIGAAAKIHASNHAIGGADPITPESIGAAPTIIASDTDIDVNTYSLASGRLLVIYE